MNGKQREEYLWSALSGFAAKWSDIMLSPCVSPRALNIEHILIVECVLKRLWGRVHFSAGNLLLNNRRFPICLIVYSAYSLLDTQIWWKRPIPNQVDIKWSENFVQQKRSHGAPPRGPRGQTSRPRSSSLGVFLASRTKTSYTIFCGTITLNSSCSYIMELYNKDNEKVIKNIYSVLGTHSAAKFEQVPSNNTLACLRHFVTLIWQDDGDYEQRQLLLLISRERQFFSRSCSSL